MQKNHQIPELFQTLRKRIADQLLNDARDFLEDLGIKIKDLKGAHCHGIQFSYRYLHPNSHAILFFELPDT